jgi:hypothetical protein
VGKSKSEKDCVIAVSSVVFLSISGEDFRKQSVLQCIEGADAAMPG